MRAAILIVVLMATASGQTPKGKQYQTGYCPRTAQLEVSPSEKFWFEGALGEKNVRMYLERGGEGVVGAFYDTADWEPLTLGGQRIAEHQGAMELTAFTEHDREVGFVKGHVTRDGLEGTWSNTRDKDGFAFHLKKVTQPKCDGSEPWKIFEDGRWPIHFSYPGSWHVSSGARNIALACPDPSLMVYDAYEISVMQGAEANNATSDFIQCGDKWIYGYECVCENANRCKSAVPTDRDGMTILNGDEMEWRVYCRGGGYAGSGWGERRILTFGDTWIVVEAQGTPAELVERIVASAGRKGN